jgi:hypothetical protein
MAGARFPGRSPWRRRLRRVTWLVCEALIPLGLSIGCVPWPQRSLVDGAEDAGPGEDSAAGPDAGGPPLTGAEQAAWTSLVAALTEPAPPPGQDPLGR